MEIIADASAIMAVVAMEPEREKVIRLTRGAKILPIKNDEPMEKSPFEDIPGIKVNISTQEIVELIRESRAGI